MNHLQAVIVTGAGAGIGREVARQLAAHGARVVVNDVRRADDGTALATQVVDEIRAAGGEAVANVSSVADAAAAQQMVEPARDTFGRLDGVVNNAGILRDRLIFNMSVDEWRAVIDVHLNGSFLVSRAAAPHFKAQCSGTFVHMTSSSGLMGSVGQANYSAAKLGIVGLSKSLALDLAKYGVRSNCIAPWAWTAMTASIRADTPEAIARVERLKKMESRKVAPLVVFLASDRSATVSGQIFGVRANEIYLFSQPRILKSLHRAEGWTPETIAAHAIPALEPSFYPVVPSSTLMSWDPI